MRPTLLALCLLGCATNPLLFADDPKSVAFFESNIRPLLADRCFSCHGPEAQKGNLRLDSLASMLQGGDSGPVIVPGKPEESLLVQVIGYSFDIKMPPKSKLPAKEIADLTHWVKLGAPWPNAEPTPAATGKPGATEFTPDQKSFWAFQPLVTAQPPAVHNEAWSQSPLDRFILAQLESAGLEPAPAADKRTLIRRATFDLHGVPPTVDEVNAFLADESPEAFARVIDRLLASPRYGERWGRHWLDVARYADSNGLDENVAYANAWRYRDYVVAAFNKDKPFDRFVQEQIAGDLLPPDDPTAPFEPLIATGFLCVGAKMLAEDDPVKMQMDIIDEQVDTIGRAFLGLTLGCARCHDHKFDPLTARDYYALAGIFKSTKTMENHSVVAMWQERPLATPEAVQVRTAHQLKINEKQTAINRLTAIANDQLLAPARAHAGDYFAAAVRQTELNAWLKQVQPIGASADEIAKRSAIVLEAEKFVRGNVLADSTNYGKDIGVIYNKGELPNVAEYDVAIEKAGVYQLEIRYAAAESRSVSLLINGELVKPETAGKVTGTWYPDTQQWHVEGFFPLKAGQNTIRLERKQPFPHFDKLLLVPAHDASGQSIPLTAPLADGYALVPEFVSQWSKTLEQTATDSVSPFTIWQTFLHDGKVPAAEAHPLAARFADLANPTREAVAKRFAELLAESERTWQQLKSSPEGKSAAELPDAGLESLRKLVYEPQGPFAVPPSLETRYPAATIASLATLRGELKQLQDSLPQFPTTMAVAEATPENLRVHLRGSHLTLGDVTPRQFPQILAGEQQSPIANDRSGRRDLADWLTRPDHPLTSRVIVNRVWQWHFGEGLVRSPDNFGRLGERPTHPELLDWLARRFVADGWSLKRLHRSLMLSSTYQMSTAWNERAALADPENRLLWRMNRRRLEVEALRDSLLAISGRLDNKSGGTVLPIANHAYVTGTASFYPPGMYDAPIRSVYLPVVRSALYDVFQAFDFADPSVLNGRRDTTTVAPQALFMMNSNLVADQTRVLAGTLLSRTDLDDHARVDLLYQTAYSRPPSAAETARGLQFIEAYSVQAAGEQKLSPDESRLHGWQALCRAVLAANEFIYVE